MITLFESSLPSFIAVASAYTSGISNSSLIISVGTSFPERYIDYSGLNATVSEGDKIIYK
jgi:hypothetical protein